MARLSVERRVRIYDDDHGFFVEARPDGDALGLCELIYSDGDKDSVEKSFSVSWAMAEKLAQAIVELAQHNEPSA